MTEQLVREAGLKFYSIPSGKLRRYFAWETFGDFFKIIAGFFRSLFILMREKPDVLFSKGGYVSVPVAMTAWAFRIPVITHESDLVPGLATRIISKFAKKVCVAFRESEKYFPGKAVFTGNPVRKEILAGNKNIGYKLTGFSDKLPVLLVMGGSLGAKSINEALLQILPELNKSVQVVHITGKHALDYKHPNYFSAEFLGSELKDIYAISDLVVARAGAGTLFELAAVAKPSILIPLGPPASRGEQIKNAEIFAQQGAAVVIPQAEITPERLLQEIHDLLSDQTKRIDLAQKIKTFANPKTLQLIIKLIQDEMEVFSL